MNELQAVALRILTCSGPREQTWVAKGSEAQSQSHIPGVETQAGSGRLKLSRLEPYFCLFQHRGVAVWWYREGSCRFLLVSMSLPVPSAAAHLASRAPEGTDLAVPMLGMEG